MRAKNAWMEMPPAHPLATQLAALNEPGRVLLVGVGNGRNLLPFRDRDSDLDIIENDRTRLETARKRNLVPNGVFHRSTYLELPFPSHTYGSALATHLLQHGDANTVAAILAEIARVLKPGGLFYATVGSQRDARFGYGRQMGSDCWMPLAGDEAGVPHLYLDEPKVRALFAPAFEIEGLDEQDVDDLIGRWQHREAQGTVHWFVRARRRSEWAASNG